MSLLTYAQLSATCTEATATQEVIDLLAQLGFPSNSWQSASIQRTMVQAMGWVYMTCRNLVASSVTFGFNETAEDDALTYFAASHYDNTRIAAVKTQGTVRLTGGATGSFPYAIAIGDLVVSDGTYTFRNITGGTLNASSTLDLTFEAEVAGDDSNVADTTITTMVTPLAGVTCSNPDLGAGLGWMTRVGVDAETNAALRARNRTKWAALPIEVPADGYEYIARTAVSNCRVDVDDSNPGGAGTVYVYIAKSDGAASGAEVTLVQAAVDARLMGGQCTVYAADAVTQNFDFDLYHESGYTSANIKTAVEAAITAFVNSQPVSGNDNPPPGGLITLNALIAAISAVTGVSAVVMTTPSSDITVPAWDVIVCGTFPAVGQYHAI